MKKKTVISIHGGLGNQLFQVGLAMKLARETEVILTPWRKNCRLDGSGNPWASHFEVFRQFSTHTNLLDKAMSAYTRTSFKVLNLYIRTTGSSFQTLLYLLYWLMIKVPRIFQISVVTSTEFGYFEIPKPLLRNYIFAYYQTISASVEITESLVSDRKFRKLITPEQSSEGREVLVVHVRRSDYKDNPQIGLLSETYFSKALEYLSQLYEWDELWLFSDDTEEARGMIPEKFRTKLRVIDQGEEIPIKTLAMMTRGNAFILSNSTFGWWSAVLAEKTPKFVLVPTKWFFELPEPKGLIPIHWNRV